MEVKEKKQDWAEGECSSNEVGTLKLILLFSVGAVGIRGCISVILF